MNSYHVHSSTDPMVGRGHSGVLPVEHHTQALGLQWKPFQAANLNTELAQSKVGCISPHLKHVARSGAGKYVGGSRVCVGAGLSVFLCVCV